MTEPMTKSLSAVQVKDAEKGTVSAVFSTFNVKDSDGDVTLPGAIKDGTEVVISAYGHGWRNGSLPVGKGLIRTTDTEAILEGQFFLDTVAGKDTFTVVKELGGLGEWSYSLHNVVAKTGQFNGEQVKFLESIHVKEVSPVLLGAGVNTRTLVAKGLKFSDEGDAVLAAVDAFVGRAKEVMVLRAEKGRSLSGDTSTLLTSLDSSLSLVRELLVKQEQSDESDDQTPEDIKRLAAEARARDLFSNLPEGEAS